MDDLGNHMSNLFAAVNQFLCRLASARFQAVNALPQIIGKPQHLLNRTRQLGQVLEPVTAGTELRPAKALRGGSDRVYPMTLSTVETSGVWLSGDVTTPLEELQWLLVTGSAHLERRVCIGPRNEVPTVSLDLVRLRRISSVASITSDARGVVGACLMNCYYLAQPVLLLSMATDAVVSALSGDLGATIYKPGDGQKNPDGANQFRQKPRLAPRL